MISFWFLLEGFFEIIFLHGEIFVFPKFFFFLKLLFNVNGKVGHTACFVLFCGYEIHQTGMLQIVSLVSLESSQQGGVHGLGSMKFGLAMQKS
jgi:hypothetical protein